MKNAIILHGKPSKEEYYDPKAPSMSNANWIPWLQGQLLKHNIWTATPEVPNAYQPDWPLWCKEVERFDITPETIVIGHSCGGGFWLRWLSEHKDVTIAQAILVAPSQGYGWGGDEYFFEHFSIDPNLTSRTRLTVLYSDDDHPGIQQSVREIKEALPHAELQTFHGYGHFTYERMGTHEFPELLAAALQ